MLSWGRRGGLFWYLLASDGSSHSLAWRCIALGSVSVDTWTSFLSFQHHPTHPIIVLYGVFLGKDRDETFLPQGCCSCCSLGRALFFCLVLCSPSVRRSEDTWQFPAGWHRTLPSAIFCSLFVLCGTHCSWQLFFFAFCLLCTFIFWLFHLKSFQTYENVAKVIESSSKLPPVLQMSLSPTDMVLDQNSDTDIGKVLLSNLQALGRFHQLPHEFLLFWCRIQFRITQHIYFSRL